MSFWAQVPHYLPAVPSAPGRRLVCSTAYPTCFGAEINTDDLQQTATEYQEQVSAAVSQDSDLASYIQMLEERYDAQNRPGNP